MEKEQNQPDEKKRKKKEEKLLYFEIGRRLKEFRENGKYTQEQFAEVLEVNVEHYRRLENGKYALGLKKLETLSKTYNLCQYTFLNYLHFAKTAFRSSRCFRVCRPA